MEYNNTNRKHDDAAQSVKCKIATLLPAGVICIAIAVLLLSVDVLQIIVNFNCRINNGSEILHLLEREQPGVLLSASVFNVTNAEEFLRGSDRNLKLQEVGPFTYQEMRSNVDLELDEEAEVVRYSPRMAPVFLPEKSIANPRDVNVTMPNIAMLAMSSTISSQGYFAKTGFGLLLKHLGSKAIVDLTVQDFLWGFDEPLIKLGNQVFPGWISFEKLGVLDRLYANNTEYRLEVSTKIYEKLKVKAMNGYGGLKYWDYEDPEKRTKCNTFTNAYEGIMYPNHLSPGAPLRIFRNVLCRQLELEYLGSATTPEGVTALRYQVANTAYDINNDTDCYCGRGTCISGVSDLSPCFYDLPLALSNAHFLYGDQKLFDRLEGLHPNEEDHGSEILIEPKTGLALKTTFSVQVNLVVGEVDFNDEAGRFSNMVVPVCIFKMTLPELNESTTNNLKIMYIIAPILVATLVVIFFLIGILMLAYSIHLLLPRLTYVKGKGISFRNPNDEKSLGNTVPLLGIKYLYSYKQK